MIKMQILAGIRVPHVSAKGAYIAVASIGFQFTQNCLSGRPTNFEIAAQMHRIESDKTLELRHQLLQKNANLRGGERKPAGSFFWQVEAGYLHLSAMHVTKK